MTPFEGLLNDEEMAAVLTYVRNSFGNKVPAISPEKVRTVREQVAAKKGFYNVQELEREVAVKKTPLVEFAGPLENQVTLF